MVVTPRLSGLQQVALAMLLICSVFPLQRITAQVVPPKSPTSQAKGGAVERPPASQKTKRRVKIPRAALVESRGFALAEGIEASLFAAEPLLGNPVALEVDDNGDVYVCETYRQERGVEDNRQHAEWLDDDLASQTVADRLALLNKHFGKNISAITQREDRIRFLQDRDGDGRADRSVVFAAGFADPLDGTGAGILVRSGNVFYACIPSLYAFRDDDRDGRADRKTTMLRGFGVRVAYRGHDLHGLNLGHDGRLYFTVGDRGFHVETESGIVANAETGAVFRCEMDGTGLEVIATGLRNPQDLVFDDYGNLFTADNNSDSGDLARWLHVVPDADFGWRMPFQYLGDRGPWNADRMWDATIAGPAAYVLPPIANLGDGPSGLSYYPGTGFSADYTGNFFFCDFRGEPSVSGVRTFKLRPRGASFELIDPELFLWNCLVTDVEFGPEGAMYVSDWVEGWTGTGKGRIYRLFDPKEIDSKIVKQVATLLSEGVRKRPSEELARLLTHADRRIRREAQFELAGRTDLQTLTAAATLYRSQLARLHGIWGLGQIARLSDDNLVAKALTVVNGLLSDPDEMIRAAAVEVLGEARFPAAKKRVWKRLYDTSPRVRSYAAIASARYADRGAIESLIDLAIDNDDSDPVIRHGVAIGLAKCGNAEDWAALATHQRRAARMAGVLAARRAASPVLSAYLGDSDPAIVAEAVRAIHDVRLDNQLPQLAALIDERRIDQGAVRRVLHAHYRLGQSANAMTLANYAADSSRPTSLRQFALELLGDWPSTSPRDRVLGSWRPSSVTYDRQDAVDAVRAELEPLMTSGHDIRSRAARIAVEFGIEDVDAYLLKLLWDRERPGKERAGYMLALSVLKPQGLREVCEQALEDPQPRVRAAGRIVLTRIDPVAAVPALRHALSDGSQLEKQSAIAMLAAIGRDTADETLIALLAAVREGNLPDHLHLDVVHAAQRRAASCPELATGLANYFAGLDPHDPLAPYRMASVGGDEERGGKLFVERESLGCVRCHQIDGKGGRVGPDLTHVGEQSREYLLASIVLPDRDITEGFESLVVEMKSGKLHTGIVQKRDKKDMTILTAEEKEIVIDLDEVVETTRGRSSMPEDLVQQMTLFDLRDLLEYLSNLKAASEANMPVSSPE